MLAPLGVAVCFFNRIRKYSKEIVFYIGMLAYSTIVSLIFFHHIELNQVVFTTYVFFLYILIKELKIRDPNFESSFWRFINAIVTITVVLAWIQHFVPYVMPYLEPPMNKGAMSVYFTNENELGAALAAAFVIYLYILFFTKRKLTAGRLFNTISIPIILYLNDAKLSMMGIIVALFLYLLYYFRNIGVFKRLHDNAFVKIVILIFVGLIITLFIWNPKIRTRDYTMSIRDMFFNWIIAIFQGQASGGLGTYQERSSAIVYGFREYFKTYGFGIGIGNSVYMLSWPQYILRYAKSMHNIILQCLVELGYFAAVVYVIIIKKIRTLFVSVRASEGNLLKAVFFISLIFISSQSSVGFLSNYLELAVIIFICLMDSDKFIAAQKGLKRHKEVVREEMLASGLDQPYA